MNRIKAILAAGTLTGLVLMTALVFGFSQSNGNGVAETAVSGDANYTQQLEGALQLMQSREAEYQTQIETANQTILQLQEQANSLSAPASASGYTEYEEEEEDDDDDYEEYEEHEEEEDDDDD